MITKGKTYKLDNKYLRLIKRYVSGLRIFQVCTKDGVIKEPVRAKNGFITDHGTRLVFKRIDELIEIK